MKLRLIAACVLAITLSACTSLQVVNAPRYPQISTQLAVGDRIVVVMRDQQRLGSRLLAIKKDGIQIQTSGTTRSVAYQDIDHIEAKRPDQNKTTGLVALSVAGAAAAAYLVRLFAENWPD